MLKITISGAPGEGKTTLAYAIAHLLNANGIDNKLYDSDVAPPELFNYDLCIDRLQAISKRHGQIDIMMSQSRVMLLKKGYTTVDEKTELEGLMLRAQGRCGGPLSTTELARLVTLTQKHTPV